MSWADFPWGPALTGLALLIAVLLLAMDERNRRKFPTRDEMNGMRERLEKDLGAVKHSCERTESFSVQLDDRQGESERHIALLQQRQDHDSKVVAEKLAEAGRSMENVMSQIRQVQHEQARIAGMLQAKGDRT